MKLKTILALLFIPFAWSCEPDESIITKSNDAFIYFEDLFATDVVLESKIFLSNGDKTHPVNVSLEGQNLYQLQESDLFFVKGNNIMCLNLRNNRETIFVELPTNIIHDFQVSPDRKKIAFSDYKDVFVLELNTKTLRNITEGLEGDFRFPKWSSDGQKLLVRNNILKTQKGDTYPTATANFKTYSLSNQLFQDIEMFDDFAYPGSAEWTPDNKRVVYEQYQAVFIFDTETRKLRRITSENEEATYPRFSPDGSMISYFTSDKANNLHSFLVLYSLETGTKRSVIEGNSFGVSWNADSKKFLFRKQEGIFSYNLENETETKLVESRESHILHSAEYLY